MSGETPAVREALTVYAPEAPETERVPPGYKHTEVGVIPEDWEVKALHEVANVSSGGTPARSNPSYWGGNIPWATTAQIDFSEIATFEQYLTEDGLSNSAAKIFPPGTLLMAMYGQGKTRGKVGMLGVEATTNQACAAILLDDTISHEYVFQYLSSKYESIRKLSNTGNQENLNGQIIKSIQIPVPSEQEQRAISTALSDVNALISALDKLIAKKRAVKTAAMQQLLTGKQRLPGFSGEWSNVELGELGNFSKGIGIKKDEVVSNGIPCVRYGEIYTLHHDYIKKFHSFIPESVAQDSQRIKRGDLLFTGSGETIEEIGKCVGDLINKYPAYSESLCEG